MNTIIDKKVPRGMFLMAMKDWSSKYMLKEPEDNIINIMMDMHVCSLEFMTAASKNMYRDIYMYGINVPKDSADVNHYLPDYGKLRRVMFNFYSKESIFVSDEYGRTCRYSEMPLDEAMKIYDSVMEFVKLDCDDVYARYSEDDIARWENKCRELGMNPSAKNPVLGLSKVYDEDYEEKNADYRYRCYLSTGGILSRKDFESNMSGETSFPAYRNPGGKNIKWSKEMPPGNNVEDSRNSFLLYSVIALTAMIITGWMFLAFIIFAVGCIKSKEYIIHKAKKIWNK